MGEEISAANGNTGSHIMTLDAAKRRLCGREMLDTNIYLAL